MEDKKKMLFDCAKELFATKGFKDTNVADITKMAGVSVGTFYNYYPSKDKLFMEIFEGENTEMMKGIMASIHMDDEPIKMIKDLLKMNGERMMSNPILRQWYNQDVYNKIEQIYREENGLETIDFVYRDFIKLVGKWQDDGKMRNDISSEMIMAIFGAIIKIGFHKEEIGLQYFPAVQDYMTEFVLKGLTNF